MHVVVGALCVMLVGCGRTDFDPVANRDAREDATRADATRDTAGADTSITIVQMTANDVSAATTLAAQLAAPVASGDIVVVALSASFSPTAQMLAIADAYGTTYLPTTGSLATPFNSYVGLLCGSPLGSGADPVQVTLTAPADLTVIVLDVHGATCTIDGTGTNNVTVGATYSSGSLTTTHAPALLVAVNFNDFAGNITFDSSDGFVDALTHNNSNGDTLDVHDLVVTSPGTYSDDGTSSATAGYDGVIAGFDAP